MIRAMWVVLFLAACGDSQVKIVDDAEVLPTLNFQELPDIAATDH